MAIFTERRKFKRYPIYSPLQYKAENSPPKEPSITLNLSEGGALISVNRKLEESSSLIVRMILKDEEFFIRSRIIHIQQLSDNDPYSVGIEFMDRAPAFTMKFYEELETIMSYQRRYSEEMARPISLAEASMKWYRNSPAWA